ncbi:Hypothetical predicted protein [Olea europaea subsp. europaea]|uniref:Uncharacterized protein n=1 Tax=Olea europaea subsp. europaea TaxID=158383 RepID=A0A8S0SNR8_OLEEU|nr:Hypothetical predicted protein [Olea europaea subsp. europaea]
MIETPSAATECTLSKYSTFPLFQQEAWPLFVESWTPQPIFSDQICKNSVYIHISERQSRTHHKY